MAEGFLASAAGNIGARFIDRLEGTGRAFLFFCRIIRLLPTFVRNGTVTFQQMQWIGIGSLPLVIITSLFTGGVAAVQASYQFQSFIPLRYLGVAIGKSVVIELGPVLTALVVGGRVGASIAAELGTMRVTEQIDALEALAIDPIEYLVVPRFLAGLIMLPAITVFSDLLAILGASGVSWFTMDVAPSAFFDGMRMFLDFRDIWGGLVKSFVFGMIIASMGCYYGFQTEGGAEGVGMSTTRAVVASCLLILVTDYLLATLLFSETW